MAVSSTPVRLDAEITAAARKAAGRMSRSVAEQISHWARIGRELERSPEVSLKEIEEVLAGVAGYDSLTSKQQALVRSIWTVRMTTLRNELRLDKILRAAGHRYAELDADGKPVIREARRAPPKARVIPLEPKRKARKTARRSGRA